MKFKKVIAATLAAAALGGTVMTGIAGADGTNPPTNGTGWDDNVDQIVGGGSDTTYAWAQFAERIYNQAGGDAAEKINRRPCVSPVEQKPPKHSHIQGAQKYGRGTPYILDGLTQYRFEPLLGRVRQSWRTGLTPAARRALFAGPRQQLSLIRPRQTESGRTQDE